MTSISTLLRRLRKTPLNSLLIVLILGVGLGAVLFALTLINGMILRPLPFPDPDRLFVLGQERKSGIGLGELESDDFLAIKSELGDYGALAAFNAAPALVMHGEASLPVTATRMTSNLTALLGTEPVRGRMFSPDEDVAGAPLVVLVSERMLRGSLGFGDEVLGARLRVNGREATIIGVMPAAFGFPSTSDIWLPAQLSLAASEDVTVLARLNADVSVDQAALLLGRTVKALGNTLNSLREDRREIIQKPLDYLFVDEMTRVYLWLMLLAAGLVLLVSCANASNLYLIQVLSRRRELALRNALGAGGLRLALGQLLDAVAHSAVAAGVALMVARFGIRATLQTYESVGQSAPYFLDFGLDWRIGSLAFAASVIVTLLSGFVPARRAAGANLRELLVDGEHGGESIEVGRAAHMLVVVEVALAVVLIVGAATTVRSLSRIADLDFGAGVEPARVETAQIELTSERPITVAEAALRLGAIGEALRSNPTIASATLSTGLPGVSYGSMQEVAPADAAQSDDDELLAHVVAVDEYFLDTFGLRLLAGRGVAASDEQGGPLVAVIDQRLAQRLFGERDALGRTFLMDAGAPQPTVATVIGVISPIRFGAASSQGGGSVLLSLRQRPQKSVSLAVIPRAGGDDTLSRLPSLVRVAFADAAVHSARGLQDAIDATRVDALTLARVFSTIGILSLFLAVSGLYGLLAFGVRQRRREIGIRRALGAGAISLMASLSRRVSWQLGLGLGIGLPLSIPWSLALVDPSMRADSLDLGMILLPTGLLLATAAAASLVPLWRALRIEPYEALRNA